MNHGLWYHPFTKIPNSESEMFTSINAHLQANADSSHGTRFSQQEHPPLAGAQSHCTTAMNSMCWSTGELTFLLLWSWRQRESIPCLAKLIILCIIELEPFLHISHFTHTFFPMFFFLPSHCFWISCNIKYLSCATRTIRFRSWPRLAIYGASCLWLRNAFASALANSIG